MHYFFFFLLFMHLIIKQVETIYNKRLLITLVKFSIKGNAVKCVLNE